MKILRVCCAGLYKSEYERRCIAQYTGDGTSYEQAIERLREEGLVYPAQFSREMKQLGVECEDIVTDVHSLQRLWHAHYGNGEYSLEHVFLEQVAHYKPDVIYFQELDSVPLHTRRSLKERFPFLKLITGFKGFPPRIFSDYKDVDHIFISYPDFLPQWEAVGVSTTILPHCFDPGTSEVRIEPQPTPYDCTFVGSTGYGNLAQEGRYHDLVRLAKDAQLHIWGKEKGISKPYYLAKGVALETLSHLPKKILEKVRTKTRGSFNLLIRDAFLVQEKKLSAFDWFVFQQPIQRLFPNQFHSTVFGREYLAIIASSRISLNRHTDEPWEGGNIRTFEVTGMGTCLLTDSRKNLNRLFSPDEIVTYSSGEDCIEKIKYLLSHDKERMAIAARGMARTKNEHRTVHRCKTILEALTSLV